MKNYVLSNSRVSLDVDDLSLKKLLANPTELRVEDNINWICPDVGDKVKILSYDTQVDVNECVRVSNLPYLTIKEVHPIVVGIGNGRYCWAYEIEVVESHLMFLQYHYKLL
jgi:hypothetical protein